MKLHLLLGEQTYTRNEHESGYQLLEAFPFYMRTKLKSQQCLWIKISKLFLKLPFLFLALQ